MKTITLFNGEIAFVDDIMFPLLNEHKWYTHAGGYAATKDEQDKNVLMHHMVIGYPPPKMEVDHRDRNKLNNQRFNLRFVTKSVNGQNGKHRTNNKSGFRGVCWDKHKSKYMTQIMINGRTKFLGYFSDPVNAAITYDVAARELYGPNAATNLPLPSLNFESPFDKQKG